MDVDVSDRKYQRKIAPPHAPYPTWPPNERSIMWGEGQTGESGVCDTCFLSLTCSATPASAAAGKLRPEPVGRDWL